MEEEEWNRKKDKVVVLKEGIHTPQELTEFLIKEQSIRDPYDTVQYKLILVPDY